MPLSPAPRKAALIFIFVTVALDMLGVGLIIPVLPTLIEQLVAGDTVRAAQYVGFFGTLFALMQFFAGPILGALSDSFGRRPVVLLSNLGLSIDYIIMALAPGVGILLFGRMLAGATSASVATAGAYIADVTAPEKRAQAFGMLSAAFGLGFVIGPAIGGLLGEIDIRYPFWAAAAMSFVNFIYGYFVLPESLAQENRRAFSWRVANPIGGLRMLSSNSTLWSFGSALFLSQLAHTVLVSVYVIYLSHRFGWGPADIGWLLAAVGLASVVVQGGMVRPLVKFMGEKNAALLGLLAGAAGLLWYGFAWEGALIWLGVPLTAMWGLFNAAAKSIMSNTVDANAQGQLQGVNTSLAALANTFGPTLFAMIFAYSIDPTQGLQWPGLSLWIAGLILLATAALILAVKSPVKKDQPVI
jgi:MFS transporter, DHA1 family, tetracycline resistance protein